MVRDIHGVGEGPTCARQHKTNSPPSEETIGRSGIGRPADACDVRSCTALLDVVPQPIDLQTISQVTTYQYGMELTPSTGSAS
jgi:hypothetical protein